MSTLELFFATSKKCEVAIYWTILAFSLLIPGVSALGCLVTDTIEFEDAINHPIEILDIFPGETILTVCDNQSVTFWVVLWDPDVEISKESAASAHLSMVADTKEQLRKVPSSYRCKPPSSPVVIPTRGKNKDKGALVYLSCSAELTQFNAGTLVEVTMTVSDLGFVSSTEPDVPRDANVANMRWTLKIEGREICNEFR